MKKSLILGILSLGLSSQLLAGDTTIYLTCETDMKVTYYGVEHDKKDYEKSYFTKKLETTCGEKRSKIKLSNVGYDDIVVYEYPNPKNELTKFRYINKIETEPAIQQVDIYKGSGFYENLKPSKVDAILNQYQYNKENKTLLDTKTNLMWDINLKNPNMEKVNYPNIQLGYDVAKLHCEDLEKGGVNGWKVPNKKEWLTITKMMDSISRIPSKSDGWNFKRGELRVGYNEDKLKDFSQLVTESDYWTSDRSKYEGQFLYVHLGAVESEEYRFSSTDKSGNIGVMCVRENK